MHLPENMNVFPRFIHTEINRANCGHLKDDCYEEQRKKANKPSKHACELPFFSRKQNNGVCKAHNTVTSGPGKNVASQRSVRIPQDSSVMEDLKCNSCVYQVLSS
ncbi:Scarecrow-like protein 1 [Olea europaea subsp. europaea]|uniref:Scarecrow-like protein 1 n=1 Tax=Olea europaea subsp. europaea TaxID=158383 RepID=A0A8S0R0U7_OLEEU|nr:Scarecrow-like protein 1 [Olea europaea subsp. europaea]